jgi:glycosyltransferase involved in cell wall biosynthesis
MMEKNPSGIKVCEAIKATFALCAYNQEKYIREAIEGAFSQTYSPLQILISDDCSTDNTFEIMREMVSNYSGPHRITLNRNNENLGIGRHVNKLFEMADGEVLIGAAGDDVSESERSARIMGYFSNDTETLAVGSLFKPLWEPSNENGGDLNDVLKDSMPYALSLDDLQRMDVLLRMAESASAIYHGATSAYRIHIGRCKSIGHLENEDLALQFRGALLGRIRFIDEKLVRYRIRNELKTKSVRFNPKLWCEVFYRDYQASKRIYSTIQGCIDFLKYSHLAKNKISYFDLKRLEKTLLKTSDSLFRKINWIESNLQEKDYDLFKFFDFLANNIDISMKTRLKFKLLLKMGFMKK